VKSYITQCRAYGWWCSHCEKHKDINKVKVVKIMYAKYVGVVCVDCNTELSDCFLATKLPNFNEDCSICQDRFQCLTRADAVIDKELQSARSEQIHAIPTRLADELAKNMVGIRSYTGRYYDKLEQGKNFCLDPDREDCNHSFMRANYNGHQYKRCSEMKYDTKKKEWYCRYGRERRGI
jgi:hypothetical protein